jgi:hypothetical protein
MMSTTTEVDLSNFYFDVDSVSERALTKPVDQAISISGISGSSGYSSTSGSGGFSGSNGGTGACGTGGGNGTNGCDAQFGQSGTDSQHAFIWLNGTVENVSMQVKTFQTLNNLYTSAAGIDWNLTQSLSDVNYNFQLAQ